MSINLPANGRCLCGNVGFECTEAPLWSLYCHCESCRLNTGSPATAFFGVADGTWRWTGDMLGAFESEPGTKRYFCSRCGTPMAYKADKFPNEIHFYTSALSNKAGFEPTGHVHAQEGLSWHEIKDDLPRWKGTLGKDQLD